MSDLNQTGQGIMPAYRAKIAAGELKYDPVQANAVEHLQNLWAKLRGYNPNPKLPPNGWFSRMLRRKPVDDSENYPNGLYIVGEVGRGKTMLMDMFYAAADVPRKRRVYFHEFMQQTHKRFHEIKKDPAVSDPIPPLADIIAQEAALLCFDEFQVHDIVDAIILGRLFEALFARQVVVVATSNTLPDDLFKGQPGRDAFLPFIALLKQRLDVLVMESEKDYRRGREAGLKHWVVPVDEAAHAAMDRAFTELTEGYEVKPETLFVQSRKLLVPQAANGVARFSFEALCKAALGAGDYLTLAIHYHTLVIDGIPKLNPDNFDEARRFVTLIDELYEHRVKLYASAAAYPDDLYSSGTGAKIFERTASRLEEIQSQDYNALPHLT